MDDIDKLLAEILDETKPLPVAASPAQVAVTVAVNAAHGNQMHAAMDDPDTFLESLMEAPVDPIAVAQATEATAEMALADALEPESHSSVIDAGGVNLSPLTEALAGVKQSICEAAGIFSDSGARATQAIKMPEFKAADFAATMDIRNFATLVTLQTARWHAKAKDRQASKDAAIASNANAESFETRKRLLVGADGLLKAIHKTIDEARAAHYELTLPWTTTSMTDMGRRTGGRLLPNTLFVDYTMRMAQCKQAMDAALAAFIPEYPKLIATAQKNLGRSFNPGEYPNPSSIAQHFDLSFDFQPIPKGDDFKGLPQVQLDALARKVNENTQLMAENAMQDVWTRTRDAVAHMAERLGSPDKLFHTTLVDNVRTVAKLLAHLNITGDAKVETIRQKIEKNLCGHDAKELRENPVLRTKIGALAASILQEMDK